MILRTANEYEMCIAGLEKKLTAARISNALELNRLRIALGSIETSILTPECYRNYTTVRNEILAALDKSKGN